MTDAIRTTARPAGSDLLDDLEGSNLSVSSDVFERLWHFFISMRTGLALILVLAVLTLIGTMLVQAPPGMAADKEAYAAWLDTLRPKYGGWTNVMDALGFFSIFNSLVFRGLTVLLSTSILACSVNRAPRLWKQAVQPRTVMSGGFYQHAALRASLPVEADVAAAQAVLERELRAGRYRTVVQASDAGVDVYADRFRWGPFGTVFAHLSIILILIGALLGAGGFRDQRFAAPVGSKVAVGNGTGLTLEATSFMDSYYTSGEPADYASHLLLFDASGKQVGEQTIRVNEPLRYGDITFYQSFFGAAADLQIADASGAPIFNQGVALQWTTNDETRVVGQIDLPSQDLTIYVVAPRSGEVDPTIRAGQMQIEVYKGVANTLVGSQVVSPGKAVTIGDLSYTFVRERQFTGLIVARDPGALFVWLGAIVLVFGIWLVFFFPNRRIWARIRPAEGGAVVEAGALTRHDVMFETAFAKLIGNVKLGLESPSGS